MEQKTQEDYLRVLYEIYEKLEDRESRVKSVELAKGLGISKPSTSEMVRKLAKEGLVKVEEYGPIFFTDKGLMEAKKITHTHRVIEVFLTKVLGFSSKSVEKETHLLEHAFSDESIRRLDKFLNNPKICPHGKRIH